MEYTNKHTTTCHPKFNQHILNLIPNSSGVICNIKIEGNSHLSLKLLWLGGRVSVSSRGLSSHNCSLSQKKQKWMSVSQVPLVTCLLPCTYLRRTVMDLAFLLHEDIKVPEKTVDKTSMKKYTLRF
ncbi:hypothetical protein PanWU01x14_000690 [Parasponia andersonii]|uniref:Uncharacterized protein n=1 Tax=Parasponia andersonii TaxID=3476 RepID=A0A2P5E4Q2_PARAD|nr:hypothetical protein PanWU01x14_000690 [Parasponia andersonii]